MRIAGMCLALIGLVGCEDFNAALEGPGREKVVAPAGLATGGDIADVAKAGTQPAPAANPQQPAPVANGAAPADTPVPPAAAPAQPAGPIIGKTEGRIVDLVEAKKNPKIVEVENKAAGSDPLTVSFNAYVSITSRASVLNFKHQMDILKETNGGNQYPSFKEAMQLMKQLKIEVASLPPYQMYGYDAKTGGLVLLEDKGEKIRLYKAHNIPLDEADKPFDTP